MAGWTSKCELVLFMCILSNLSGDAIQISSSIVVFQKNQLISFMILAHLLVKWKIRTSSGV